MKTYDWFWKVEPGVSMTNIPFDNMAVPWKAYLGGAQAQFPNNIVFDVFRFMRDQEIIFGVTDMAIAQLRAEQSSSRLRSLVLQNPDLVHKNADLTWLLKEQYAKKIDLDSEEGIRAETTAAQPHQDMDPYTTRDFWKESSSCPTVTTYARATGATTTTAAVVTQTYKTEAERTADAFTSWASEHLGVGFEVGSLCFLRSAEHQTVMRHLHEMNAVATTTGDGVVAGLPARTISATILLPKESIWNYRHRPVGKVRL